MILGTKIKWFSHLNKNAPVLTNVWGSMLKVLDACLIDGYSEQQATAYSIVGNNLTLTYPTAHLYQQYQVLNIKGASTPVLNGDHRIVDVSSDGLSLTIEYASLSGVVETALLLTTKIAPLGWEKVYSALNKAVYKFTMSTGISQFFFVDDTEIGGTYAATWAKYARVGLSEGYAGEFQPTGVSSPLDWSQMGASLRTAPNIYYMGTHKWFYATSTDLTSTTFSPTSTTLAGVRPWLLTGDTTYFYIIPATYPNSMYAITMGVGEYDRVHQGLKENSFLNDVQEPGLLTNGNISYMSQVGNSLINNYAKTTTLKSYLNDMPTYMKSVSLSPLSESGTSDKYSRGGPVNHFRSVFVADNIVMGSPKNLYWLGVATPYSHLQKIKQGEDIYLASTQYCYGSTLGQVVFKIGSIE